MAEKKPSQPVEPPPDARQIKKDFRSDVEQLLGVDDETLKQKQQPPSQAPPSTGPGVAPPARPGGGTPRTVDKKTGRKGCRSAMRVALVVTIVVAIGAYFFTGDRALSGVFDQIVGGDASAPTQQATPAGGTKQPSTQEQAKTRRWLIVRTDNSRPQFTIELQGDGPTGRALWLEPPQATGTYKWSGDKLLVKLVLQDAMIGKDKAGKGVYRDQHFLVQMSSGSDGGLTGTMSGEGFRYSWENGVEPLGMKAYPAVGEPK